LRPATTTSGGGVVGTTTLTYDNNGNLTSDGVYTYTWDYRNRLATTTNSGTSTYAYDQSNNRVKLTENGVTTFSPNTLYSVTVGASTNSTATTTKNIFANGLLLATIEHNSSSATTTASTTIRFVAADNLTGSNIVTDQTGAVVETLDYYPYGGLRLDSKTNYGGAKYKYAGTQYDAGTGLDYAQQRYYNSARGNFISEDPVFLGDPKSQVLTDPQSLNVYSYANDNPITRNDPTGRAFGVDDAAGLIGGGLVGGALYVGTSFVSQQSMTWGGVAGSVVSGGIVGWGTANAPETGGLSFGAALALRTSASAAFGGTGALAGNFSKQLIDTQTGAQKNGSISELAASAAFGFVTGGLTEGVLPNARIPMLSSGRGNWNSTGIGLQTKMSEGMISRMSLPSAVKSAVGSQAANSYKTLSGGIVDIARTLGGNSQQQNVSKP